jgi:PHD/YefM family antitoxin component YafN of YafNO toxin-antitoxin module
MTITTITSSELQARPRRAQKAARDGLVIVMDDREPTHVMMSYAEYRALGGSAPDRRPANSKVLKDQE